MTDKIQLTEDEWLAKLGAEKFQILRLAGTERAFTGEYERNKATGVYMCGGCGAPLFSSDTKYDSGSGWPSYTEPMDSDAVEEVRDTAHGMVRTEVRCRRCGSHLGHLFPDGPAPTGQRYCMNSLALDLVTDPDDA